MKFLLLSFLLVAVLTGCIVEPDEGTYTLTFTSSETVPIEEMTLFIHGDEGRLVDLLAVHLVTQALIIDDALAGRGLLCGNIE